MTRVPSSASEEEDQRDAAEVLHSMGTKEALARLVNNRPRGSVEQEYALLDEITDDAENLIDEAVECNPPDEPKKAKA